MGVESIHDAHTPIQIFVEDMVEVWNQVVATFFVVLVVVVQVEVQEVMETVVAKEDMMQDVDQAVVMLSTEKVWS